MTTKPRTSTSRIPKPKIPKLGNGQPTLTKPQNDLIFGPPAYGIGHPNIIFRKDYRDPNNTQWSVVVETMVPVANADEVRRWLESGIPQDINRLAKSVVDQVPDRGDLVGARHMIAAAFGYELDSDNRTLVPRPVRR